MSMSLTKDDFDSFISKGFVLVDFWAPWCGPCRMLAPLIEDISKEREGKVRVAKVNVDEQAELAEKHKIASIPTLMMFRDGKLIATKVGSMPRAVINLWIDECLKKK